jgi:hypothetical protein
VTPVVDGGADELSAAARRAMVAPKPLVPRPRLDRAMEKLPPPSKDNFHWELLLRSAEYLNDEQHQPTAAVLLAHAAAEMYVHWAFLTLFVRAFGPQDDDWEEALPGRTFKDKRTRVLWRLLTDNDVSKPMEVWKPYSESVELRNRTAHAGKSPTEAEARATIHAVHTFLEHLENTVRPIRALL